MPSNASYRPLTKKPSGGAGSPLAAPLVLQANTALTAFSALFLFLCLVASLAPTAPSASARGGGPRRAGVRAPACNPFALPGYVARLAPTNAAPAGLGTWRTFDPACAASPLLAALLSSLPSTAPHHLHTPLPASLAMLRNATALLVGDRTDYALLTHVCDIAGEKVEAVDAAHPWGAPLQTVPKAHRWPNNDAAALKAGQTADERELLDTGKRALAHYCYLSDYDFLLTSVYHYGTDTASRWRSLPSFVAPSLFEDRVSDLFVPYISAMSSSLPQHRSPTLPPVRSRLDLVIFSSGFWDLAAWAREDIKAGSSATSDLSESRLLEWRARSVDMVAALAKAWPKTSLAWRSSQIPSSSEPATVEWWTGELGEGEQPKNHPLFSLNRLSALTNARRSVLEPHGDDVAKGLRDRAARFPRRVRDMPWGGEKLLGQGQLDPVSPSIDAGGSIFTEMLLHQLAVAASGY